MPDEAFIKLREFLDQFPLGYPESPSGVELKIFADPQPLCQGL